LKPGGDFTHHGRLVSTRLAQSTPASMSQHVTSSKMSPNVYQIINMMVHFIISISYPVNAGEGGLLANIWRNRRFGLKYINAVSP
jgi:hypothetical protein